MAESVPLDAFHEGYEQFRAAAASVPDALFLAPMSDGGWSARDTVAHLVGWNREMVQAGRDLLAGQEPYYYSERAIDYRDMNARFVATYAEHDKFQLLSMLHKSLSELEDFIFALDPSELEAGHGVTHYRGGPGTVRTTLDSLGRDYRHHAQEITAWLAGQGIK